MKKILVTGANGFVGSHLVKALQQKGYQVYGAYREGSQFLFRTEGVCYLTIDNAHSVDSWSSLLDGVDAVVHLIARTHCDDLDDKKALPLYRKVNVDITKVLLEAAKRKGVQRFIYLSSIKAVGEGSDKPYTEETPCNPEDSYGISKREAELAVQQTTDLETVILRPPLIYGPGVKGNFAKLAKVIQKGYPLPFRAIDTNRRSLLSVDRLSEVVSKVLLADSESVASEVFNVADDKALSTRDIVFKVAQEVGCPAKNVNVPLWLLNIAVKMIKGEKTAIKLMGNLEISIEKLNMILSSKPSSCSCAGREDK